MSNLLSQEIVDEAITLHDTDDTAVTIVGTALTVSIVDPSELTGWVIVIEHKDGSYEVLDTGAPYAANAYEIARAAYAARTAPHRAAA